MKKSVKKIKQPPITQQEQQPVSPTTPVAEIPELTIDAPLAVENIASTAPVIDTVMETAKKKWIGGVVLFSIFIIATIGAISSYINTISSTVKQIVRITPTLPPPTPSPAISLRFAVWNGSGVAGQAGKVGDILKELGYEVVEKSNAPKEQTGTTLFLLPSIKNRESEIKSMLSKQDIDVANVEELTEAEYEVRIVLGR